MNTKSNNRFFSGYVFMVALFQTVLLFVAILLSYESVFAGEEFDTVLVTDDPKQCADTSKWTVSAVVLANKAGKVQRKHATVKFHSDAFATATRFNQQTALAGMDDAGAVTLERARLVYPYFFAALEKTIDPEKGLWVTPYFERVFSEWCQSRGSKSDKMHSDIVEMMVKAEQNGVLPLCLKIYNQYQLKYIADELVRGEAETKIWVNFSEYPAECVNILMNYMCHFKAVSGHLLITVMRSLAVSQEARVLFRCAPQFFLLTTFIRRVEPDTATVTGSRGASESATGENLERDESFTTQLLRSNDVALNESKLMSRDDPNLKEMRAVIDERMGEYQYLYNHASDSLAHDIRICERSRCYGAISDAEAKRLDTCDRTECIGLIIHALRDQRALLLTMVGAGCNRQVHLSGDISRYLNAFLKGPVSNIRFDQRSYLALAALVDFPELIVPVARLYKAITSSQGAALDQQVGFTLVNWLACLRPSAGKVVRNSNSDPGSRLRIMLKAYYQLMAVTAYVSYKTDPLVAASCISAGCSDGKLKGIVSEMLGGWGVPAGDFQGVTGLISMKFAEAEQEGHFFATQAGKETIALLEDILSQHSIAGETALLARMIYSSQENYRDALGSVTEVVVQKSRKKKKKR